MSLRVQQLIDEVLSGLTVRSEPVEGARGRSIILVWAEVPGEPSKKNETLKWYSLYSENKVVGLVKIYSAGGAQDTPLVHFGSGLSVDPEYQRLGVATAMYDYVEDKLKLPLSPETPQTDDGKLFWTKRKAQREHGVRGW